VSAKVAVFCDGDFWHGRDWDSRRARLATGSNSAYWLAKIARNMERDRQADLELQSRGFTVLRFWETDLKRDVSSAVNAILAVLDKA
jgi:DNA mismatch endonuclease (patch repair protein)